MLLFHYKYNSKDIKPVPIIVRSGDVMVMGGCTRLNYHGVPCLLKARACPILTLLASSIDDIVKVAPDMTEEERLKLEAYLQSKRININVRQVLPSTLPMTFEEASIAAEIVKKAAKDRATIG